MIRGQFKELKSALAGETNMTEDQERMLLKIKINTVPDLFLKQGYPSLKPLNLWFQDLKQRMAFYQDWIRTMSVKSYWISAMFYPQGFLTSIMQNYARKMKCPIDQVVIRHGVTRFTEVAQVQALPFDGVYIHGLLCEGFRFDVDQRDRYSLQTPFPGELYATCHVLHFVPEQLQNKKPNMFQIPIYKTLQRFGSLTTTGQSTNFIVALNLSEVQNHDFWVLQGAALFCALNY